MRYSLAKVAKELNLSKTTVSLVLSGKAAKHRVSEKTCRRILEFCRAKNYSVNVHARRINQQRTGVIGLFLESGELKQSRNPIPADYASEIIGGILEEAGKKNRRVLIDIIGFLTRPDDIIYRARAKEIDGFLYYGFNFSRDIRKRLKEENVKYAAIAERPDEFRPVISCDNREGCRKITEYLINKGHEKFFFLEGKRSSYSAEERFAGFREALDAHGINYVHEESDIADFDRGKAFAWAERFIAGRDFSNSAIVCANDFMAAGVLAALLKHNIRVPEEVAVTGGDNTRIAECLSPSLTTFDAFPFEIGRKAFGVLENIISGDKDVPDETVIGTKIVDRHSA